MKVGPNPFSNSINVTNLFNVNRIELVDMNGKIIFSKPVKNEQAAIFETTNLPAGMYQLKSHLNNGNFQLIKLVKF